MGRRPLPAPKKALTYVRLRPPNRVFPRVPRGYAVARLVIIRPAEPKSSEPPDWRRRVNQSQRSLKGTWTVRLLRIDPSVLQAHLDKAPSLSVLKPAASTADPSLLKAHGDKTAASSVRKPPVSAAEIKPLHKDEERRLKDCTEKLLQQQTLPNKMRENVLQCSGQEDIAKIANKSQRIESEAAEERLDESTGDRGADGKSTNSADQQNIQLQEKSYTCSDCDEGFRTLPKLLVHQRSHTGKKQLTCRECGKSFLFHPLLVMHQRIHTGGSKTVTQPGGTKAEQENPYACKECGKRFSDPSTLIKHHQIHALPKQRACSECGKIFVSAQKLQNHMRKHTGEKPYTCAECGKSFSQQSSRHRHQQIHHPVKSFVCSECGMSYDHYSSLVDHHQHRHTGVKPYTCDECGKGFSYSSRLQIHQRLHTGEREELCSVPAS